MKQCITYYKTKIEIVDSVSFMNLRMNKTETNLSALLEQ